MNKIDNLKLVNEGKTIFLAKELPFDNFIQIAVLAHEVLKQTISIQGLQRGRGWGAIVPPHFLLQCCFWLDQRLSNVHYLYLSRPRPPPPPPLLLTFKQTLTLSQDILADMNESKDVPKVRYIQYHQ